ncbi:MAG: TonB-dependent receptor, partial [Spirochaetes bacterium]|nr:TonB-dependent receptor [Spirochaetota bacterium]
SDAWNLQAGAILSLSAGRELALSVARKTRFSTMKDRYSYKLGTAVPNPGLTPEIAVNYDLSYKETGDERPGYSLSIFFSDLHDVIQQVTNAQGNLFQISYLIRSCGGLRYLPRISRV